MLLQTALLYASMGWKVFPLVHGSKKPTGGSNGYIDATTDAEQIKQWWSDGDFNIGIATGKDSNLTVIDIDGKRGLKSYESIIKEFPKEGTRVVATPNGHHLYFQYNPAFHTGAGFLEGLDVRTDGGYVVAPPSVVNNEQYSVLRDYSVIPISVAPEVFLARNRNDKVQVLEEDRPTWVATLLRKGVSEGQRNQSATSLAGYFHSKGIPNDIIETIMFSFAENCSPPFATQDLRRVIESVSRYDISEEVDTEVSLAESIREYIIETDGKWWHVNDIDDQFGLKAKAEKNNRRQILHRMKKEGFIEQHQTVSRKYRHRVTQIEGLNYKQAKRGHVLDIRWPLQVEEFVNLYEGNLVVVAGSPNAGKTAMMLNLIYLNQHRFPVYYFCSEMGETELSDRLALFNKEGITVDEWKFDAFPRSTHFADVIKPDCINIIDFLELTQEIYLVNEYLTDITHAIGKGVAIVAVQKKIGADLGRGQEFSLEKPRLYLSMDQNKMRIMKGKNWATATNPNGMTISYDIIDGYKFVSRTGWTSSG